MSPLSDVSDVHHHRRDIEVQDEINLSTSGRVGRTGLYVRCRERYYHEKHYKFTGATRVLSCVCTSTCHRRTFSERIFGKKNRDFYLILTRAFRLYYDVQRNSGVRLLACHAFSFLDAGWPTPAATTSLT